LIKSIFSTTDKEARRLVLNLLLASVPAGIAGILFNDFFETMFGSPKTSALMLLLTGIIVLSAIFSRPRGKSQWNLKWHDALIVGIAQALAIMPGISRSGSTITAGLHLGIEGKDAASFSFLLSIPAILGAALVEGGKISLFPLEQWPILALGMISAGIMGYITIASMMKILSKGKLYYFAPYCILVGMIAFFML
jgi:undecaprenyl-diphosphatase